MTTIAANGSGSRIRKAVAAIALGAVVAAGSSAPAGAATIVVGDPLAATSSGTGLSCGLSGTSCTLVQTHLTEANAMLAAPVDGVIDSWTIDVAQVAGDKTVKLRVLRPAGGGAFTAAGTNSQQATTTAVLTFPVSPPLPVRAGDMIGLDMVPDATVGTAVRIDTDGQFASSTFARWSSAPADGSTSAPTSAGTNAELRFNASLEPFAPVLTALSRSSGSTAGGEQVVISGDHFAGATAVSFGPTPATSFHVDSGTQITATAPTAPAGTVDVRVTTAGGTTDVTAADRYTFATVPAAVSNLALSNITFAAENSGPPATNARKKAPRGTKVSFRLNEAATVRFTVTQRTKGRKVKRGKKTVCAKPTRKNHKSKRCTRVVTLKGSFSRSGVAGKNTFHFTGRLNGRKLKPGRYRLVATPSAGGKRGKATSSSFRIVR